MARALSRAVAAVGWAALALAAAAGVALAAVALLASLPVSRGFVAARAVGFLDDAIAGSVALDSVEVLPGGAIELRGLEIADPEGHLVLSVGRARLSVDVTRLRRRVIGLALELDAPSVLLEEEADGVSIARAFAPARPAGPREGSEPAPRADGWRIHVSRLAIRDGDVWWVDEDDDTRLEATGLDVDARGVVAPGRIRAELRLTGALAEPVEGPVALELAGTYAGGAVRLPVLRAQVGGTSLALVAEGDLERRSGRVALRSAEIARDLARTVAPEVPRGDDLTAAGYAESDGTTLTAAVRAEPAGASGEAHVAIAARLGDAARALGLDVALDRLDPSRLSAQLPGGAVTLSAHGAVAGGSLRELRGRIEARAERSRLRGAEVLGAELVARVDRGAVEVSRASVSAPGLTARGTLRWREHGPVGGQVSAEGADLAVAARNAARLLGVKLPALSGRARVEATLGGTADAPTASGSVEAPRLALGGVSLGGVRLRAEVAGPARDATARLEGRVDALRSGDAVVARGVSLRAALADGDARLDATADLPGFEDPARLEARGRLAPGRDALALSALALSYPGARWTLARPASVSLEGPSVDRLELEADGQRIALEGGLGRGGALDARLAVSRLDLSVLPAGLLPPGAAPGGSLTAEVRATGTTGRPELSATFAIRDGSVRGLAGIAASGSAAWSGAARRATASVALSRGEATLDVSADVPLPLAARPAERLRVAVRGDALPVGDLLAAAGSALDVAGDLSVRASLEGTAGAPSFRASAALARGRWRDLDGIAIELSLEDEGERLEASVRAALEGAGVASARAEAPLDAGLLLARPEAAVRALRSAPLSATAELAGLELSALSGRAGAPEGLAGRLDAAATLSGSLAQPRGEARVDLVRGTIAGYRDVEVRAALSVARTESAASGRITVGGEEAVRFAATLGVPAARLGSPEAIRAAPLRAEVVVPGVTLAAEDARDVPLAGTLSAKLVVTGTPRAPEAVLHADGKGVAVRGRPLGEARLDATYAGARAAATLRVAPPAGGTLRATAALEADLGLGAARPPLGEAPAEVALVAEAVDLSVLAALFPGTVRSAGGVLTAELAAQGPLATLRPRGKVRVRDGSLAVSEYGAWSGIALDAAASPDEIAVTRLEARRGGGTLQASGAMRGLRSDRATLEARAVADDFTIARNGMDLATLDLEVAATGTWNGRTLSVEATVPGRGEIRLPERSPRDLQELGRREDIVVGQPTERAAGARGGGNRPFAVVLHLVVPKGLFVKSEDPLVNVELRADVTLEQQEDGTYARGYVEAIRGTVEPIGGRSFELQRARVQFSGGPPAAATLDVEARYETTDAIVTAKITGPLRKPEIKLTSEPSMDEREIALLIATGRRELKAGAGGAGTLTGEEAGKAALGAIATKAFKELVADKLPFDTFALESGAIRAGRYVTDKIYVAYTRRFEANALRGENANEVRVEYQITPRWTFESRYGTESGGASLIWSKDF